MASERVKGYGEVMDYEAIVLTRAEAQTALEALEAYSRYSGDDDPDTELCRRLAAWLSEVGLH